MPVPHHPVASPTPRAARWTRPVRRVRPGGPAPRAATTADAAAARTGRRMPNAAPPCHAAARRRAADSSSLSVRRPDAPDATAAATASAVEDATALAGVRRQTAARGVRPHRNWASPKLGAPLCEPARAVRAWAERNGSAVIAARRRYDDTGAARPRMKGRSTDVRPVPLSVFAPTDARPLGIGSSAMSEHRDDAPAVHLVHDGCR